LSWQASWLDRCATWMTSSTGTSKAVALAIQVARSLRGPHDHSNQHFDGRCRGDLCGSIAARA